MAAAATAPLQCAVEAEEAAKHRGRGSSSVGVGDSKSGSGGSRGGRGSGEVKEVAAVAVE